MDKLGHTISKKQIVIKSPEVLQGLMERRFAPLLVLIILSVAREFGIVITESYREKRSRNDLHGTQPVRALDLRSWCYPDKVAYEIKHWINSKWIYDPNRPRYEVAIIHKVGKGGLHFHIQVCPNTIRREV